MGMFRQVDVVPSLRTGRSGEQPRIRVDTGSTGFYAGREFRMFHRLNIPTATTVVIKAEVPVNTILEALQLQLVDGWVEVETVVGGTEGGTFGTPVATFPANNMNERPQPPYQGQVVLTTGGTHTGGTVLDVLMARTSNATAQAASVGDSELDTRGIAAGTYYFRISALEAPVTGVIKARWEERPEGTQGPIDYGD